MWRCVGCGVERPDRVRACGCETTIVRNTETSALDYTHCEPVAANAEYEFRSMLAGWRERHAPSVEQETEMIERIFNLSE